MLTLAQIFPYTLGANSGTTVTAIIVDYSHLQINIPSMIVWWLFRFVPIKMAEKFAGIVMKHKIIAIIYIVIVFFVVPEVLASIPR